MVLYEFSMKSVYGMTLWNLALLMVIYQRLHVRMGKIGLLANSAILSNLWPLASIKHE
jgi:hypothetical protein